jgi:hypothetical protein
MFGSPKKYGPILPMDNYSASAQSGLTSIIRRVLMIDGLNPGFKYFLQGVGVAI